MTKFQAKRINGSELHGMLAEATSHLPSALPAARPQPRAVPKVQINFSASEEFAALVAREAEKAGSTRRLFARLMRDAGHTVPEIDVSPPDTRRRRG